MREFYTEKEKELLKRHTETWEFNVIHYARKAASAVEALRAALGANPNRSPHWQHHVEQIKKDIAEIERRASR